MSARMIIVFACVTLYWVATQDQLGEITNTSVVRDIEYARTPEKRLTLDVYRPSIEHTPLPVVVWVHSGVWHSGKKNRANSPALPLVHHGFIVVIIGHRSASQANFPAQIYDCKAAIRWLRANAEQYHIDPDRIGVWGASSGGHLSALLGTSGDDHELEGNLGHQNYSSKVQAVVDFFGPTDFLQMDAAGSTITHNAPDSPESRLIGEPIQENKEKVARANPITYVTQDDPPFLIVHGDRDRLVPYQQSQLLQTALIKVGIESTLYIQKGAGHGFGGKFGSQKLFDIVQNFFDSHLKRSSPEYGEQADLNCCHSV